ncbi:interferon-induced very large GTPase 1-like [Rhinophrynus dorsalis]
MTMKQEDVLKKREQLITIPRGLYLTGPQQGPVLEQKEFTSSTAESTFHRSMERLGFSITCSAKGGFLGFQAEASTSYTNSKNTEQTQRCHTEQVFICTTKYNYIPLASCYIPKDQIRLSSAAIKELKSVEELVKHCASSEKSKLKKYLYGEFFSSFGSHANQGPLHFGGIFWWKATSKGFKEEEMEEIRQEASYALNAYVGCSYIGGFTAALGVDTTKTHSEMSHHETRKKNLTKHIELFVTKTGGPLDVDSLSPWKAGLVASNKTWSVIDRGFNLIPVWEIILSAHKEDFIDAHQISSDLINAYQAITNQHPSLMFGDNLAKAIDEAKSFLSELQSWEVGCAELQLMKLINFKQKLNEMTRSYNVWVNVCLPDKTLQDFLAKIMEFYKNTPQTDLCSIQSQMKCLLQHYDYLDDNVTAYSHIIKWVFQTKEEQNPITISDLSTFIDALSQAKNDILLASQSPEISEEEVDELNVKASVKINLYLNSFLRELRHMGKTDVELLIISAASSVGYSIQRNYFLYHLGWKEINLMEKEIQSVYEEYQNLKDLPPYRGQAFILFTGLTAGGDFKQVSIEQTRDLFQYMVDKMKCSLAEEIVEVLEKHIGFGDLQHLKKDLGDLASGDYKATVKINTENVAKELTSIFQQTKQEDASASHNQIPFKEQILETVPNQDFSNLIKYLGLENYFPGKMNQRNLHIFNSLSVNQPETESELPSCFLQMLMILDYRFRYLVYKDVSKINISNDVSSKMGDANENFDTIDDFLNNICEDKTVTAINNTSIHPMDLQMAIYHCADDFMRQYMFNKLALCQFALPFIVPTADGSGLELPLWSFRQVQKSILYRDASGMVKHKEKLVCNVKLPMVSFTRFGESAFSKSQILNNLLNKHKHDIFFHRNCESSEKNSILMEGLVEIFWFCPSGKDDDQFEQCTAFVNLHGDVRTHKRQAAFLQEIASVNVVIFSESDKNETGAKMLKDMLNSKKPLICLCPDRETSSCGNNNIKVIIGLRNRNEAKLMNELVTTIRRLLALPAHSMNLENVSEVARQHGFLVDEDRKECVEGKERAQTMLSLLNGKDLPKAKNDLLPLSGHLWHSWCEKDKELTHLQNKMNKSIEQHRSEIEVQKKTIRAKQLNMATHNPFMISFIQILKSLPKTTKLFFLQWFKIFIDDLTCDRILELRDQYNRLWSNLQTEQSENKRLGNDLQENMEAVTKEMNDSMFGLEHLLREVGQTYEALYELQYKDACFHELPKIAAEMMISGYPIELMDGDASYVPLKWIGAVFEELIKFIGDKKLFVLSVLGVQSSGKSTLLNTMFGLQFAVSAGRCTRGAFMQLVKMDEALQKDLNFDYILVIDTEGLRAMELANHSTLNHDNELATFVIGVGNMTLINVFGENPSEIKDILQIAVQAFLRMKQVKLSPSCLFVHQNVGEITALEKNMEGRRNLQKELDKMACLAAEHENCNIQRFSDVIKFDVKSHIYYFAHLWEGNPPMAPPNPIYSRNALEVRNLILQTGRKDSHQSVLSISELKVRIEDLWSALRNENFVFSFKNTLEISAYSKVENKYSQWTWQLRRLILELQVKLNNKINKGEISCVNSKDLQNQVNETFNAIMEELEIFFNEDKDKEILIQWKANIENRLKNLKTDLVEETKNHGEERIRIKKSKTQIKAKENTYEDELFRKSKQLALDLKNKAFNEEELTDYFNNDIWQKWVAEIKLTAPCVETPTIASDIEDILLQYFSNEPCIVNKLDNFFKQKTFSIDFAKHVTMHRGLFRSKTLKENDKRYISQVITNLDKKIHEYIEIKQKEGVDYNKGYFHEIINEIVEKVNSSSKHGKNFTLTNELKIDLCLYQCHSALPVFKQMHQAFQRANNPAVVMENKREEFFSCFKISYLGANSTKTFADFLCSKVLEAIRPAIYHRAALAVVDEMRCNYPAFSGNRSKLETYILIYLAEQEDFEKYRHYLHFPEQFFESFIEKCVEEYCLDKENPRLNQFLNISLDYFHKLVLSSISESTRFIKDKSGGVSEWLDLFYTRIKDEVSFSRDDLKSIEHQEIRDIEFIKEAMCNVWDNTMDQFRHSFGKKSYDEFDTKPHIILAKQLCGCWEQCPFCKAICTNTISGHDGDHSVIFHRSQAISGIPWVDSNEFVIEICSTLVTSDSCLVIDHKRQVPYKHYRKIGPNYASWSITPDTSAQPYWKWFVCHFRTNLEDDYGCKFEGRGAIPQQWEDIKKDDVIANLKEHM